MPVGAPQLHNDALEYLADSTGAQWDDASADFAFILLDATYTQADTDTTYADVSADENADVDYAPIAVTGRDTVNNSGEIQYRSDFANFGGSVTTGS